MVDAVCRLLRDGAVEGEYAPAMLVRDCLSTTGGPAVFGHLVRSLAANVSAGRAQAKGLLMVVTDRHPECYRVFLESEQSQIKGRCQVIDCFSDPLGWNRAIEFKQCQLAEENAKQSQTAGFNHIVYREIGDMTSLMSAILESVQLLVGRDNNARFSVIIDSVSTLLRHNPIQSIASLLNTLRSHGQLSSMLCMLHTDLHEMRIINAIEYLSSTVISVESCAQSRSVHSFEVENQGKEMLRVRQKRWNGRVREQIDQFEIEGLEVKCSPIHEKTTVMMGKSVLPQVQFSLQITDKEWEDRAKVVLPFEHQGNAKGTIIYDGRKDFRSTDHCPGMPHNMPDMAQTSNKSELSKIGEIHYLRDSDDECPDSDEDPDDDLDI